MNKFQALLGADSSKIVAQRAAFISEDGKIAAEDSIRVLENKKRALERELLANSDLYPDSALSLLVTKNKFDGAAWWASRRSLRVQIMNLEIEIDDAKEDFEYWFGDIEIEEKSKKSRSVQTKKEEEK